MKTTFKLCLFLVALAFAGCAFNSPKFREETHGTNGVSTVRTLSVPTWALWPATTDLAKQRANLGKTFSLGTEGLREETGSTNIADTVRALSGLVEKLKP